MKNITKSGLRLLACLSVIISAASCEKPTPEEGSNVQSYCIPDSLLKNITVDTIKSGNEMSELKLAGKITFNEDHVVQVFPFTGGHVSDVKASLGDYVEKGQLLATMNSSEMAGYNSEYKTAQSELNIAKKNLDVTQEMRNGGVASDRDLIAAQAEYDKAKAQFNKISQLYKIYGGAVTEEGNDEAVFQIKAPISGFIVGKNVTAGMEIRPDNGNSLFTISDLSEVWVLANVYETDIDKISSGDEVEVTTLSYPDRKFSGKVDKISNVLNPETNVMSVRIKLPNRDYSLKPGMFANISVLFPGKTKALIVPQSAVFYDDNKTFVVEFNDRCNVDITQVEVVNNFNNMYYLKDDSVHENDRVIDRNGLFIFTALKKL